MDKKRQITLIKKAMSQFAKNNNFILYKQSIYVRLFENILHIISFDVYSEGFDCSVAIQPLFVPSDSIDLSFGNRLSHLGTHKPGIWGIGEENDILNDLIEVKGLLEKNVIPWFEKVGTPKGLISFLQDDNYEVNRELIVGFPPYKRRLYLTMGHLLNDVNLNSAMLELVKLNEIIKYETKPWIIEIKNFAEQIKKLINIGDKNQLESFVQDIVQNTTRNLKLKRV